MIWRFRYRTCDPAHGCCCSGSSLVAVIRARVERPGRSMAGVRVRLRQRAANATKRHTAITWHYASRHKAAIALHWRMSPIAKLVIDCSADWRLRSPISKPSSPMLATRGGSLRRICECMTATNLVSSSARTERSTRLVDLDCAGRALARNWVWLEEPSRRPIRQWSPPRDTSRSDGHSPSTWP